MIERRLGLHSALTQALCADSLLTYLLTCISEKLLKKVNCLLCVYVIAGKGGTLHELS